MCLCRELSIRGIREFERQSPDSRLEYKGVKLDCGYRADIVVDGTILLEIKAIDSLSPIHDAQLLSYLKLGGWKIGLANQLQRGAVEKRTSTQVSRASSKR